MEPLDPLIIFAAAVMAIIGLGIIIGSLVAYHGTPETATINTLIDRTTHHSYCHNCGGVRYTHSMAWDAADYLCLHCHYDREAISR